MTLESALLALPIILISALSAHHLPLGGTIRGDWRSLVVLALGAGIYEELVFRLASEWFISVDEVRPRMRREAAKVCLTLQKSNVAASAYQSPSP